MPCGDGIDWQLRNGAQKYDLTVSGLVDCPYKILSIVIGNK